MKISIVMLAYNHGRFISQALDSILMQKTEYEYELIVGEDCSPDDTRRIVREYEEKFQGRMRPIYHEKNVGAMKNLKACLSRCTGDYIAFLEGDDYWTDPLKLQKQVDFLEQHKEYAAVAHNYEIVNIQGQFLKMGLDLDVDQEFGRAEFEKFELPSQTGTMMVRNFFHDAQKTDFRIIEKNAWIPADRTALLLCLRRGNIFIKNERMSAYRYYIETNGTNWSSKHEIEAKQNWLFFFLVAKRLETLSKKLDMPIDMMDARLGLFYHNWVSRHWSKRKNWIRFQALLMFLLESHKIRFVKAVHCFLKDRRALQQERR